MFQAIPGALPVPECRDVAGVALPPGRIVVTLLSIGWDTMTVQVARRPHTAEQVNNLLQEHYAFCPDNIDQGMAPDAFRAGLPHWTYWNFWWD